MKYRNFCGDSVSALGMGMMRLPSVECENGKRRIDQSKTDEMVHYAIEHGVNYFDTAFNHNDGDSEISTGIALDGGWRDRVFIATKSPQWNIEVPEDFDRLLDIQLKRLRTDHIDFYMLHALGSEIWQNTSLRLAIPERLLQAKRDGRVRHIGFSFHDSFEMFRNIADYFDEWDFCQIQLNYLDVNNQAGMRGLEYAASKGLGVIIMEPLRGGYLANVPGDVREIFASVGKTPAEAGLDFLWDRSEVSVIISGMSTIDQVRDNIVYADRSSVGMSNDSDRAAVKSAFDTLSGYEAVGCTGCGYCSVCPKHIAIPHIFTTYNDYRAKRNLYEAVNSYKDIPESASLADECIGCGKCESICPQHIKISGFMPKIARMFG